MAKECSNCGYLSYTTDGVPGARCPRCREPFGAGDAAPDPAAPVTPPARVWTAFERRGALCLLLAWQAGYLSLCAGVVARLWQVGSAAFAVGATAVQSGPVGLFAVLALWLQLVIVGVCVTVSVLAWRAWRGERLLVACVWMGTPMVLSIALGIVATLMFMSF